MNNLSARNSFQTKQQNTQEAPSRQVSDNKRKRTLLDEIRKDRDAQPKKRADLRVHNEFTSSTESTPLLYRESEATSTVSTVENSPIEETYTPNNFYIAAINLFKEEDYKTARACARGALSHPDLAITEEDLAGTDLAEISIDDNLAGYSNTHNEILRNKIELTEECVLIIADSYALEGRYVDREAVLESIYLGDAAEPFDYYRRAYFHFYLNADKNLELVFGYARQAIKLLEACETPLSEAGNDLLNLSYLLLDEAYSGLGKNKKAIRSLEAYKKSAHIENWQKEECDKKINAHKDALLIKKLKKDNSAAAKFEAARISAKTGNKEQVKELISAALASSDCNPEIKDKCLSLLLSTY